MASPGNQRSSIHGVNAAIPPGIAPRHYATMQSAAYMGPSYPAIPGLQYPMAYNGSLMNHGPLAHSHSALQPTMLSADSAAFPGIKSSYGENIEG